MATKKVKKEDAPINVGTPILDRIIVKPDRAEQMSSGGIIIPETAQEEPQRGIVLAVGPGKGTEEMIVKVGDKVLYGFYDGTEVTIDGRRYLVLSQSQILVILP